MIIEPLQTERILIRQTPPNPDWDEGIRKPLIDITEYNTRWGIDIYHIREHLLCGFYYITVDAKGKLYIDTEEDVYLNGKLYRKEQ